MRFTERNGMWMMPNPEVLKYEKRVKISISGLRFGKKTKVLALAN